MKRLNTIYVSVIFLALYGCSSVQNSNLTLSDNIANAIKVTYQTGPQIQTNEALNFLITNTSKNCIAYPIDFGLQIIMEQNGKWITVVNTVTYQAQTGQNEVLLNPVGSLFTQKIVGAQPDLSNITLTGPTNFQAIITGHLCNDKSVVIEKRVPFIVSP
jgi:hypothetical protein